MKKLFTVFKEMFASLVALKQAEVDATSYKYKK